MEKNKTNNKQLLLKKSDTDTYWCNVFNDNEFYKNSEINNFINSNKWKIISVNTNSAGAANDYSKMFKKEIIILFEINESYE